MSIDPINFAILVVVFAAAGYALYVYVLKPASDKKKADEAAKVKAAEEAEKNVEKPSGGYEPPKVAPPIVVTDKKPAAPVTPPTPIQKATAAVDKATLEEKAIDKKAVDVFKDPKSSEAEKLTVATEKIKAEAAKQAAEEEAARVKKEEQDKAQKIRDEEILKKGREEDEKKLKEDVKKDAQTAKCNAEFVGGLLYPCDKWIYTNDATRRLQCGTVGPKPLKWVGNGKNPCDLPDRSTFYAGCDSVYPTKEAEYEQCGQFDSNRSYSHYIYTKGKGGNGGYSQTEYTWVKQ